MNMKDEGRKYKRRFLHFYEEPRIYDLLRLKSVKKRRNINISVTYKMDDHTKQVWQTNRMQMHSPSS